MQSFPLCQALTEGSYLHYCIFPFYPKSVQKCVPPQHICILDASEQGVHNFMDLFTIHFSCPNQYERPNFFMLCDSSDFNLVPERKMYVCGCGF